MSFFILGKNFELVEHKIRLVIRSKSYYDGTALVFLLIYQKKLFRTLFLFFSVLFRMFYLVYIGLFNL